jgi:two-component system, NtrC family, response regulator AtoC
MQRNSADPLRGYVRPLLLVLTLVQDAKSRSVAKVVLEGAGHRVIEAAGDAQAFSLLNNGLNPDLLVYEPLPISPSPIGRISQLLQRMPADRICLMLGVSDGGLRKEASRLGVRHFLTKPITRNDLESVVDALSHPASHCEGDQKSARLGAEMNGQDTRNQQNMPAVPYIEELGGNSFFLAASPQMLEIHRQVKLLAGIDVNVLILGESGTGKEVVAQLIHRNSRRSREKFLKVNCAALPAELLESELFGHRQGAFTGAINDRQGKFEQANRGTLLLDEIGEIGVTMQAKLLHILQDGQFARLGAQETTKVDVRVLAATNVHIEDALFDKTFREDLYYRLSVFTIKIPPLRQRREEIPYLIEQILRRAPAEMTHGFCLNLSSRLVDLALLYDWRGNVRELRNFVTRAIIMRDPDAPARELEEKIAADGFSGAQSRPVDVALPCAGIRSVVRDVKDRTETEMIQNALNAFGWNRRRTAQYLNISYRALLYKIQQHQLRPLPVADPLQVIRDPRFKRQNAVQRVGPQASRS